MKRNFPASLFALCLTVSSQGLGATMFRTAVAEDSGAVPQIMCTMYNRIARGWAPNRVLNAYYAIPVNSVEVDPDMVQIINTGVMPDGTPCGDEYFAMSIEAGRRIFAGIKPYKVVSGTAFYLYEDWR